MTNDCFHRYDSLKKNPKINNNVINYYLTPNTRQLVSKVEHKFTTYIYKKYSK